MRRIPVIQHTNTFEAVMKAARRVSTPLIAARTFDPASAIQKTLTTLGSRTELTPTVQWDVELRRAVDAMTGLSTFRAEQVLAMSLTKDGPAFDQLWERKTQVIAQTPGLSVWRGGETFDDIGGCGNVKRYLQAVLHGNQPPRVVVFVDELEKALAGTGPDLSGGTTEMAGTRVTWMPEHAD